MIFLIFSEWKFFPRTFEVAYVITRIFFTKRAKTDLLENQYSNEIDVQSELNPCTLNMTNLFSSTVFEVFFLPHDSLRVYIRSNNDKMHLYFRHGKAFAREDPTTD